MLRFTAFLSFPLMFVRTLVDLRFLDEEGGCYQVHDWEEHQSYASKSEERSSKARKAAQARWSNAQLEDDDAPSSGQAMPDETPGNAPNMLTDATSMHEQCLDMPQASASNAPRSRSQLRNIKTLTTFESLSPPDGGDAPQPAEKGILEAEVPPEAKAPPCPYEAIRALYHEILPEHPRVEIVNEKRQRAMKARWADIGKRLKAKKQRDGPEERLAYLRRFFGRASESDFLTGKKAFRDGSVYIADFDKLMSPGGFVGVIEGKYDNRERW